MRSPHSVLFRDGPAGAPNEKYPGTVSDFPWCVPLHPPPQNRDQGNRLCPRFFACICSQSQQTTRKWLSFSFFRFFWRKNPGPITPRPLRLTTIRGPHRCIRFADFSPPRRGGVPACFRRLSTGTRNAWNDHCRGVGEGNAPTRQFLVCAYPVNNHQILGFWEKFSTATQKQTLWGYLTRFNKSNKKYGWPCDNCCSPYFPNWRPLCKHIQTRAVRQLLSSLHPERRRIIVWPTWSLVPEGQPRWKWNPFLECLDGERKIGKKFKYRKLRIFFLLEKAAIAWRRLQGPSTGKSFPLKLISTFRKLMLITGGISVKNEIRKKKSCTTKWWWEFT